jgi:hypothetical protein
MVMVYKARVKDSSRGEMTETRHKGTVDWITRIGGEKIDSTGEDVNEAELDDQGRYLPKSGSCWTIKSGGGQPLHPAPALAALPDRHSFPIDPPAAPGGLIEAFEEVLDLGITPPQPRPWYGCDRHSEMSRGEALLSILALSLGLWWIIGAMVSLVL